MNISPDQISVVVMDDPATLKQHVMAWDDLAASAIEPNVFYESWMLMPAIEAFGRGVDFRFVLFFAPHPEFAGSPPILCGFFPFERLTRYRGISITTLRLWQYLHMPFCLPLLRATHAKVCLSAFYNWIQTAPEGASCAELRFIPGEGAFYQLLVEEMDRRAAITFQVDCTTRALFRPAQTADDYLKSVPLSGRHMKGLRRQERRLAETGRLEYVVLSSATDAKAWIESFMQLEAAGWKGEKGTALLADEAGRSFFLAAISEAARRGRLMMFGLQLDGRFIAIKCNVTAGCGAFALKIAYDEAYASYSPGVLLEIENIRRLHAMREIEWMDACAIPEHFMINRLWSDRRVIQTLLVASNRRGGLLLSVLPLLRGLKRLLFKPQESREVRHESDE
jgi:hypothetical protein